jgi:hypothetical protein
MQYLVSDYYATGEGRTICLLITCGYTIQDDYLEDGATLKNSEKFRVAREFIEEFGYFAQGAVNLSKEEFMKRYGKFVPDSVQYMLDEPAKIRFIQRFHFNYA